MPLIVDRFDQHRLADIAHFKETILDNPYIPEDHRPHPKQAQFLMLPHKEAFFGGAAGGGKSDALLMGAAQYVHVPDYAAIIFRRTFQRLNLDGSILDRARDWFLKHPEVKYNDRDHKFTFPSGATIAFGHMQYEKSKNQYLGPEYQYVGFDEATEFTYSQYRFMFIRLRRVVGLNVPIRMRSASNPGGPGHEWVKRRFINPAGRYSDRKFIPSKLEDNPSLHGDEYVETLTENLDQVDLARYLGGDWDIREAGSKFKRSWITFIDDQDIPRDTYFVRYWDLAATEAEPGKDPDWTVGALVGEHRGQYYVADVKRIRATPKETEDFILGTARQDGRDIPVYMEQEPGASGKVAIDHYARHVLRGFAFYGWPTHKNKEVRFNPVSSIAQNGNMYVVRTAQNIDPYLDVLEAFPFGEHDDDADATSGAVEALNASPEADVDPDLSYAEEELTEADLFT